MRPSRLALGLGLSLFCSVASASHLLVNPQFVNTALLKTGFKATNFANGELSEILVGNPGFMVPLDGTAANGVWKADNHVKFTYDPGTNLARLEVTPVGGTPFAAQYPHGSLGSLNYVQFLLRNGNAPQTTLAFNNVTINGEVLGDFDLGVGVQQRWSVIGGVFTTGLTIEGDIAIGGFPLTGDVTRIELFAGHAGPPPAETPEVVFAPSVHGCLNGSASVSATFTDGDGIGSAEYSLDGGAWTAVAAADGAYDEATETVTISSGLTASVGEHQVCVRATDLLNNQSQGGDCTSVTVGYDFTGYATPVDDPPVVNVAKAGQTVPIKWHVQDCSAVPVNIADAAHFVRMVSYATACGSFEPVGDAVEEYAPGLSGLVYKGNGDWQINWKTPKEYANTCRVFYIELASGLAPQAAHFSFKR